MVRFLFHTDFLSARYSTIATKILLYGAYSGIVYSTYSQYVQSNCRQAHGRAPAHAGSNGCRHGSHELGVQLARLEVAGLGLPVRLQRPVPRGQRRQQGVL